MAIEISGDLDLLVLALLFPITDSLIYFAAFVTICDTAIAAITQTAGAKTSMSLTIAHEKYTQNTPHIAMNNFP